MGGAVKVFLNFVAPNSNAPMSHNSVLCRRRWSLVLIGLALQILLFAASIAGLPDTSACVGVT